MLRECVESAVTCWPAMRRSAISSCSAGSTRGAAAGQRRQHPAAAGADQPPRQRRPLHDRGEVGLTVTCSAAIGLRPGAVRLRFAVRDTGSAFPPSGWTGCSWSSTAQGRPGRARRPASGSPVQAPGRDDGGCIWAESEPDKGACSSSRSSCRPCPGKRGRGPERRPELAGKRLLVVEPAAGSRALLGRLAAQWGLRRSWSRRRGRRLRGWTGRDLRPGGRGGPRRLDRGPPPAAAPGGALLPWCSCCLPPTSRRRRPTWPT